MLYGDSRNVINKRMFDDPRVVSFWDPQRISGSWLSKHTIDGMSGSGDYIVWDAYYAFDASSAWNAVPTGAVAAGSDIIGSTDGLTGRFIPLLGG
jgi:hypothetical protein